MLGTGSAGVTGTTPREIMFCLIKRIEKLEQENADMNRIFDGVVNSEIGIL